MAKIPGFSVSLNKELYRKLLKLEDEEGKTTSGVISEILEVFLNNKTIQTLYKMKLEKKVDQLSTFHIVDWQKLLFP